MPRPLRDYHQVGDCIMPHEGVFARVLHGGKISVGVIKSDAHDFNLDAQGKDSCKFQAAGAKSVAVVSPNGWFMIHNEHENFFYVAQKFSGVDLILTESRTKNFSPTISLWRGKGDVIADEKVAAIFSSEPKPSGEIFQFDINDFAAAEKICKFLTGKSSPNLKAKFPF